MAIGEIKVDITGINVPLMIVVGNKGETIIYQHGKKVDSVRSIDFHAKVDEIPILTMERYVFCAGQRPPTGKDVDITSIDSTVREFV